MSTPSSPMRKLSNSQITVAAESFVAAQFALCGFDVLEQASRARFHFDLGVARSDGMMKVTVHASFNGFWDLLDRYLELPQRKTITANDYHGAIDEWLEQRSARVLCCLVEFDSTNLNVMPRIYLASGQEVAEILHEKIDGLACAELGVEGLDVVHRLQTLPPSWRFSQARIAELMKKPGEEVTVDAGAAVAAEIRETAAALLLSELQFSMVS